MLFGLAVLVWLAVLMLFGVAVLVQLAVQVLTGQAVPVLTANEAGRASQLGWL